MQKPDGLSDGSGRRTAVPVYSGVESHLGAHTLFPTTDEQGNIFRGIDGSQVTFNDVSYTDKLKAHEMVALHYYRFLILCCGLDHRLKLFGEFYDPQDRLSFVSMAFRGEVLSIHL